MKNNDSKFQRKVNRSIFSGEIYMSRKTTNPNDILLLLFLSNKLKMFPSSQMDKTSKNNNNIEGKVGAIDSISKKALTFDVHHLLFQSMKIIETSRKSIINCASFSPQQNDFLCSCSTSLINRRNPLRLNNSNI